MDSFYDSFFQNDWFSIKLYNSKDILFVPISFINQEGARVKKTQDRF